MSEIGKVLIFFGIIVLLLGGLFLVLGRTSLPLGRLPGDILYRGKRTAFYIPLTTSIIVSVVLSVLLYVISRLHR